MCTNLTASIAAETDRATKKENGIISSLSTETEERIDGDNTLSAAIAKEVSDRKQAITSLSESLTASTTSSISSLNTKIDAETDRATKKETELDTAIKEETSRATEVETTLENEFIDGTKKVKSAETADKANSVAWVDVTNKPTNFITSENIRSQTVSKADSAGSANTASMISGFGTRNDNIGWGKLTAKNGYTIRFGSDQPGGGGTVFAEKDAKTYMQIDGTLFVNEGNQEVAVKSDIPTKVSQLEDDDVLVWSRGWNQDGTPTEGNMDICQKHSFVGAMEGSLFDDNPFRYSGWSYLINVRMLTNKVYKFQIAYPFWGDERLKVRRSGENGWAPWRDIASTTDLPTKVSQLENDKEYVNNAEVMNRYYIGIPNKGAATYRYFRIAHLHFTGTIGETAVVNVTINHGWNWMESQHSSYRIEIHSEYSTPGNGTNMGVLIMRTQTYGGNADYDFYVVWTAPTICDLYVDISKDVNPYHSATAMVFGNL